MADPADIETKLVTARTKLILDKPFLGALVLRLPMQAANADWCQTTATDARAFYYNPEYIDSLSVSQTQFMLAHEALHCALSHFARRQHRVQYKWDLACDFAINPLLLEDGLVPPPNANVLNEYAGLTAEEIYPLIDDDTDMETLDQHVYDNENQQGGQQPPPSRPEQDQENKAGQTPEQQQEDRGSGDGDASDQEPRSHGPGTPRQNDGADGPQQESQPRPLSPEERDTLEVQWQQRLAGAAQQAMQAGKLGDSMARLVDHLLQPQLPWRMLLARYMTATARDDFSYMRPSRREGDAIMPSLRSAQIDVAVVLDTSGSIKAGEIDEFVSEVNAIKGQMRARVTLLACDAALARDCPWVFEPWEELEAPGRMDGGGGTDFRPAFDWLDEQGRGPDLTVYFTDAQGRFPAQEPNFPVIWLVKGRAPVPWGQRIQLN